MNLSAPPDSIVHNRSQRRRSLAAAYANAAVWGLGSGLANTTLVTYLAREYRASGLAFAWLLAAPSLAGLMRLGAPVWIERVGSRRSFCIAVFLASAAVLATLPALSAPGVLSTPAQSIVALGATWAGHQVLESIAMVGLWSWLGDLAPPRVRGRFIGRREACLNAGVVVGTIVAAAATYSWDFYCKRTGAPHRAWQSYAACGLAGAVLLAVAALLLLRMNEPPRSTRDEPRRSFRLADLIAPIADPRFRRFLAFGLWFSFSNGIVQTAQSIYFVGPLNLSYAAKKTLDGASRGLQAAMLPRIGAAVDRRGNVPILALSQSLIAAAPLFFLYATPLEPWWILGAYACWLAYGGHNVSLPNLMLGLSPPGATANYAAAWFAWSQLAFSLSVLAGGAIFDALTKRLAPLSLGGRPFDVFFVLFAASWILKSIGVVLALRVPEPGASPA